MLMLEGLGFEALRPVTRIKGRSEAIPEGIWCRAWVVAISVLPLSVEVRKALLRECLDEQSDTYKNLTSQDFKDAMATAMRFGGPDALGALIDGQPWFREVKRWAIFR